MRKLKSKRSISIENNPETSEIIDYLKKVQIPLGIGVKNALINYYGAISSAYNKQSLKNIEERVFASRASLHSVTETALNIGRQRNINSSFLDKNSNSQQTIKDTNINLLEKDSDLNNDRSEQNISLDDED